MLVRSWNLFNGNALPPRRRAFLDEMVRLATADDPDVLCLQEVPAWALPRFTVGDVAAAPHVGPLPVPASVGRALTAPNHGLLRSLFAGQGNAIQVAARLRVIEHDVRVLNPSAFRTSEGAALGLDRVMRLAWAKERRIVQVVRLEREDSRTFLIANTHCTSSPDARIPEAEVERAARFALERAAADDVVVLAGDFNVVGDAPALQRLTDADWGFSEPGPGIDHVLVRGGDVSALHVWDAERRLHDGVLLSDHAPVEVEIA